ncbi:MFS transporter [Microbacterium sp.]|uniref:MFS transporter n=1 Tax=Microbacterium sp. TaxID=51671 RepID=UPI002811F83F|nr:MFS transporter [Microbacterium sp.]
MEQDASSTSTTVAPPPGGMRTFLHVLVNTAVANITTSFLWFGLTFWIYAETRNVIATGVIGGAYMLFISVFSMFFGTLVDRFRKKAVMLWATVVAFFVFCLDTAFFFLIGEAQIIDLQLPWFWIFAVVMLAGAVVEQLRSIALSTTVTLLVPDERHANANGMVGTVQGVSMLVTSVLSGLAVGFLGMGWTLIIGLAAMLIAMLHLASLRIPEREIVHVENQTKWVDIRGGWQAVLAAPGLLALVLFSTLNNFVGGVYMALMDPYGIDLFGVQGWGIWFAVASTGFIAGGAIIAATGLGKRPMRTMLLLAAFIGGVGAVFTLREWGWLYILGCWLYMACIPAIEAAEQTVIQRVVPYEKQGRVFGFAMTFEAAAAPITSLLIAPIAQVWVIPFLREDGEAQWAWLLGEGENRGIALIFLVAGVICVLIALLAFLTPQYRRLSTEYAQAAPVEETAADDAEPSTSTTPVSSKAGGGPDTDGDRP